MKFFYRKDRDMYRVWIQGWSGDEFEVLDESEFEILLDSISRLGRFSITISEVED